MWNPETGLSPKRGCVGTVGAVGSGPARGISVCAPPRDLYTHVCDVTCNYCGVPECIPFRSYFLPVSMTC